MSQTPPAKPNLSRPGETLSSKDLPVSGPMPSVSRTTPEHIPEAFGRYRILKKLGEGGMGAVYLARDTQLDRQVALKVPTFGPGASTQQLERFFREAKAAAAFDHPNLCPVYDAGTINGTHYLTMPFIEGKALADFSKPDKPLASQQAAKVVRKIALALAEAHKRGVVHRDLKPANVMINRRGEPVVMDFGLARMDTGEAARLTGAGAILGTPSYMAPEQVKGEQDKVGPACDIYALGVILFELLTGRRPFEGPTTAVLARILLDPPPAIATLRPDVDAELASACHKAMAKEPGDRFASMKEFAGMLADYLGGPGGVPPPLPTTAKPPKPATITAATALSREDPPLLRTSARPMATQLAAPRTATFPEEDGDVPISKSRPSARRSKKPALPVGWIAAALALLLVGGTAWLTWTLAHRKGKGTPEPIVQQRFPEPGQSPPRLVAGKEITNSIGMKLVLIPAGTFTMGSPATEADRSTLEGPQREVEITKPFYLGVYEVTQGQYERVMGTNPSWFSTKGNAKDRVNDIADTSNFPVETVFWNDAVEFCRRLSDLAEEKQAGRKYRLPTEAEWEYACRAGSNEPFHFGKSLSSRQANCNGNFPYGSADKGPYLQRTCAVGSYEPNRFGVYDMHGNVWEWCADWVAKYEGEKAIDPTGPERAGPVGANRVHRGGGWDVGARECRSAGRGGNTLDWRNHILGFRVALVADQPDAVQPKEKPTAKVEPNKEPLPRFDPLPVSWGGGNVVRLWDAGGSRCRRLVRLDETVAEHRDGDGASGLSRDKGSDVLPGPVRAQ